MSSVFCVHCGGSNPAGAAFCQYCGSPMAAPAAPMASGTAVPPPPPGWGSAPYAPPPYQPAPPPRRRRRLWVIVLVVVVVVILVVSVVAFLATPAASGVQVQYINIWAPDNVCGLNSNPISFYGFNWSTGQSGAVEFSMANFNATACTVVGVTTNTSGFGLSDVQVPLQIPASDQSFPMNMTITAPSSSFSGNLNLVFS